MTGSGRITLGIYFKKTAPLRGDDVDLVTPAPGRFLPCIGMADDFAKVANISKSGFRRRRDAGIRVKLPGFPGRGAFPIVEKVIFAAKTLTYGLEETQ
jgi:hypothetical protein